MHQLIVLIFGVSRLTLNNYVFFLYFTTFILVIFNKMGNTKQMNKQKNMTKSIFLKKGLIAFLLLITSSSFGQNNEKFKLSSDWQLLENASEVNFYVKRTECTVAGFKLPLIYTFMKIENLSNQPKSILFNFGLQYTEGCNGCEAGKEHAAYITIPAKTSLEGDCNFKETQLTQLINNPNLSGGWKFERPVITNLIIE